MTNRGPELAHWWKSNAGPIQAFRCLDLQPFPQEIAISFNLSVEFVAILGVFIGAKFVGLKDLCCKQNAILQLWYVRGAKLQITLNEWIRRGWFPLKRVSPPFVTLQCIGEGGEFREGYWILNIWKIGWNSMDVRVHRCIEILKMFEISLPIDIFCSKVISAKKWFFFQEF